MDPLALAREPASAEQLALVQGLFVQNVNAVRGFVLGLWPDAHRANDIVQEVFLTVCAKAADFEPGTNFRAWAFAIARNKVRQGLHSASAARVQPFSPEVLEALGAEPLEMFDLHDDRLRALRDCVQRLAPQARRAVESRYQQAQSPPEIARAMHWTTGAVKVALTRAKAFLRDCVTTQLSSEKF